MDDGGLGGYSIDRRLGVPTDVAKKIILLSDGTGNSAAKVWRTNVWRTFEALDLSGSDQVAFYDDGVGTSTFKPLAILGGAFGVGLKRNVIALYKFACRNKTAETDEIFGFGFSRGAFTIRLVMGMIVTQGLVNSTSEGELERQALAAYRAYRAERFHTILRFEDVFRWLRKVIVRDNYDKALNRPVASIRFVGLWDTVAAYGLPVDEMATGVNNWLWPLDLPDHDLSAKVERACQALAIDDERTTFHPELWNETPGDQAQVDDKGRKFTYSERISQVWFAGVHSNVGGGYPDDALAEVSLYWMLRQAQCCGLRLKSAPNATPDAVLLARSTRDKDGRLYDSRSGLSGYYRYGPRKIAELTRERLSCGRPSDAAPNLPKIHESVLKRIQNAAHPYVPPGLPGAYEIVADDSEILPLARLLYESPASASARAVTQESAWDKVWVKRIVYFLTVGVTLALVAYPLMHALPPTAETTSPIRWVSDLIRLVGTIAPAVAAPWLKGYERSPFEALALIALIFLLISWGKRLQGNIRDAMTPIWFQSIHGAATAGALSLIYRLRTSPAYVAVIMAIKLHVAPIFFALFFVWSGLTLLSHAAYVVQDDAGWVCKENPSATKTLNIGDVAIANFSLGAICNSTGVQVAEGEQYRFRFTSIDAWSNRGAPIDNAVGRGGYFTWQAPGLGQTLRLIAELPLRRELTRPWLRLVGRIGGVGGEEVYFDPHQPPEDGALTSATQASRPGELFIFANDAVIGIPGWYDYFYRQNAGTGVVKITRIK